MAEWRLLPVVAEVVVQGRLAERSHGLLPEWWRLQLLVDRCPGHGLLPEWRRLHQLVIAVC
jgi:hypothetical protein